MEKSSIKEIFDAYTGTTRDGCDPDWCREVLDKASREDIELVKTALSANRTESETAYYLGIRD